MSPVICHLSLKPTLTDTDPYPAYSPNMHINNVPKREKISYNFFFLANISNTLFAQKSSIHLTSGFPGRGKKRYNKQTV